MSDVQQDLEEKVQKIKETAKNAGNEIDTLGAKALSILKTISKKRETKRIEDLTRELKF